MLQLQPLAVGASVCAHAGMGHRALLIGWKHTRDFSATSGPAALPLRLSVVNTLSDMVPGSYSSSVVEGGVLMGALRRLQETQHNFKFTVKWDPDFGLFLESVNGVAGNVHEQTYWEILSESSEEHRRIDLGLGCYKPKANEHIILRFTKLQPR